ncbi:MAG TPA: carbonic anhydrase [Burkholderiaceae bacterium]|jgi:carbonic anhydrase
MDHLDSLIERNQAFAAQGFSADLKIIPSKKTFIIGCVDPRVDPATIFKLEPGEAVVIRNVGGRVDPALLETMALLRTVAKAAGNELGLGWNLILLHHNDCGIIGCYRHAPDLLSRHLGVTRAELEDMAISNPDRAVAVDIAALKANPQMTEGFMISGLVYDVHTGRVRTVVPAELLRPKTAR